MEVNLSSDLQQWNFEKGMDRSGRTDSGASSPDIFDLRIPIDDSVIKASPVEMDTKDPLFQARYMSSEEVLSPVEPELSDTDSSDGDQEDTDLESIMDYTDFIVSEAEVIRASERIKSNMAIQVSIVPVGRPKVVEVPIPSPTNSPIQEFPAPEIPVIEKEAQEPLVEESMIQETLERQPTQALPTRSSSLPKRDSCESAAAPVDHPDRPKRPTLVSNLSATSFATISTTSPSTSLSPASSTTSRPSTARTSFNYTPITPKTPDPLSPRPNPPKQKPTPAPTNVPQSHSRLRNFSRSLFFARTATAPSKKLEKKGKHRRDSQVPETPARSSTSAPSTALNSRPKMVPRGATERAPIIELPPFPNDGENVVVDLDVSVKKNRLRRKKSMLSLVADE